MTIIQMRERALCDIGNNMVCSQLIPFLETSYTFQTSKFNAINRQFNLQQEKV